MNKNHIVLPAVEGTIICTNASGFKANMMVTPVYGKILYNLFSPESIE